VLDIGCNDGTLLSFLDDKLNRIGFEPATNVAILAQKHGTILPHYFTADRYLPMFDKAKTVFAIAMFYDLEDPVRFCREVARCLADDGVFVVQQNYLTLMLQNTAYDNVCHEHLTYFSLASLKNVLGKTGLEIYHVEQTQINGGSFKTFIDHKGFRDVDYTVPLLEQAEQKQDLSNRKVYRDFAYRVRTKARALNRFLDTHDSTMIYGAGTRGATLFEFSTRLNKPKIIGAVDNNPDKQGHYYLDTGIAILSREQALKKPPDYFLVLPYHLADEIIQKEKAFFPDSRWIVPLPEFRVV
jgi:SAM-dependent methyltransferase